MLTKKVSLKLAVCSWSLQSASPAHLLDSLKQIGISRIQCALDPIVNDPKVWGDFGNFCQKNGIEIVSGMFGTIGEDYSTLESIKQTGGLVPDGTWEQNWIHIQKAAQLAAQMGLKLVSFHAGFLPHEKSDPSYAKLVDRIRKVVKLYAQSGITLAMETGQETADTLRSFLESLQEPNLGVNFDPANMILYDKGEPVAALKTLAPWIKQCHIKDANRTQKPGTWGEEVVVGTGQVNWSGFFETLADMNFVGNGCIEREAGNQRIVDIKSAQTYITKLINI